MVRRWLLFLICSSACGDAAAPAGNNPDAAIIGGTGSCARPSPISLGASESGSTEALVDVMQISCAAIPALPESVFQLILPQATTVQLHATDESGQGVGVEVRRDSCTGIRQRCFWQPNGLVDASLLLDAATYLFIVERAPPGRFTFSLH